MEKILELTTKQRKVLEFIRDRIQSDIPPTIREIAKHMRFSSTGTVRDYLNALEKKGYLKRTGSLSRAIELTAGAGNASRIPILGSILAGNPSLAYEEIQGYVDARDLLPRRVPLEHVFALRVKGESMIEAGIVEGDLALIQKQAVARNGEIVAALLEDNEVTLKKFRHKNNAAYLEPANAKYQPIHKEFTIIGKLIAILRRYP